MMKKIELKEIEKTNGKVVYQAIKDGEVIYESAPTGRRYIAMMITKDHLAQYRFGRIDLIGKGDSQDAFRGHWYPYLAVVPEVEKLVFIPEKEDFSHYTFKYLGREVIVSAASDQEAISRAKSKLKRYFRIFNARISVNDILEKKAA